MPKVTIEPLVSAKEIATQCGLHSRVVLRWATEGRIPCVRVNARVIKFDPAEVRKKLREKS